MHTLGDVFLAVTPADTDAVDNIALLGLVAQSASLVRARGTGSTVDDVQLAVLPATIPRLELQYIVHLEFQHFATHRTRRRNRRTSDCFFL